MHAAILAPSINENTMELVYGKVFQTMLTGFLVGGGLSAFRAVDDRVHGRPTADLLVDVVETKQPAKQAQKGWWLAMLKYAAADGARASVTVGAGVGVYGACSFLVHGRHSERFFQPRGDGAAVAAGMFAAAMTHLPPGPGLQRIGSAALVAGLVGLTAGSMAPPSLYAPP